MASKATKKSKPGKSGSVNQICRLCMGENSLEIIVDHDVLHRCISDFLSVKISNQDGMSQFVCAMCRKTLLEFNQFSIRCTEVQDILQAKLRSETEQKAMQTECQICHRIYKTKKQLLDHMRYHGPKKHVCTACGKSFARKHQLAKHNNIHSKQKNGKQRITQFEGQTFTVHEVENIKPELYEVDGFSIDMQPQLDMTKSMAAGTSQSREHYNDIMLQQNEITVDSSTLNEYGEIIGESAQTGREAERHIVIDDIIVIEKVKVEPDHDDYLVTSLDDTFAELDKAMEDKTINQNVNNAKYSSTMTVDLVSGAYVNQNFKVEKDITII